MYDKAGRFISPDSVGPVDPWTGKINLKVLMNPQRLNPYAYALNNPYRYIDPDGAFSVEIHRALTANVLSGNGFSPRAIERVNQGNAYVDRLSNQGSNYQHSMRDVGQNRDVAIAMSSQYSRDRLIEAGRRMSHGDYEGGLSALGEGLHTVQDRKHNWITLLGHGPAEFRTDSNPTAQQETRALSDTRQYLNDYWSVLRSDLHLNGGQIEKIRTDISRY